MPIPERMRHAESCPVWFSHHDPAVCNCGRREQARRNYYGWMVIAGCAPMAAVVALRPTMPGGLSLLLAVWVMRRITRDAYRLDVRGWNNRAIRDAVNANQDGGPVSAQDDSQS